MKNSAAVLRLKSQTDKIDEGDKPREVQKPGLSLAKSSARGVKWLLAQTIGNRVIMVGAQVVLARLLSPADFGCAAIANSTAAMIAILAGFGVDDVIVSRSKSITRWLGAATWISFILSSLSALALAICAPIFANIYHDKKIKGLLFVTALSLPLTGLTSVPAAYLRSQLKFSFIATYSAVELFAAQLLTIAFALWGFGSLSFVLPLLIAAAVKAPVFILTVPQAARWTARKRQIVLLLRNGATVFSQKLLLSLRDNGDYLTLGLLADSKTVGYYFMAFKLAAAPIYALVGSVTGVLSPALANLRQQPQRQLSAALTASRILAALTIPFSLLQAALAGPIVHLFFGPKWTGAALPMSLLSPGLAFDIVPCVAGALMTANGRFLITLRWVIISLPFFFVMVALGCISAKDVGVAAAVSLFFMVTAPIYSYLALGPLGCSIAQIRSIYLAPTLCSLGACFIPFALSHLLKPTATSEIVTILISSVLAIGTYILLIRLIAPSIAKEIEAKIPLILPGFRNRLYRAKD